MLLETFCIVDSGRSKEFWDALNSGDSCSILPLYAYRLLRMSNGVSTSKHVKRSIHLSYETSSLPCECLESVVSYDINGDVGLQMRHLRKCYAKLVNRLPVCWKLDPLFNCTVGLNAFAQLASTVMQPVKILSRYRPTWYRLLAMEVIDVYAILFTIQFNSKMCKLLCIAKGLTICCGQMGILGPHQFQTNFH